MTAALKILLLESSATDAISAEQSIKNLGVDFELQVATDKEGFFAALAGFSPDVILSNHSVSAFSAAEALTALNENQHRVPFILVTDAQGDDFAVQMMKLGAADYLLKSNIQNLAEVLRNTLNLHNSGNSTHFQKGDIDHRQSPAQVPKHLNIDNATTQEKLTQSEHRYRLIVETAQEGIMMLDEHENIVFVNKKMCDMLGYAGHEMVGKPIYDFKDDEGKKIAEMHISQRKQGINETVESLFVTKQGHRIWTSLSASGIFDASGSYQGALGMFTDITLRKNAEDTLKKSEANLSAIIENTNAVVYSVDKDLKFITFNKQCKNGIKEFYNIEIKPGDHVLEIFATVANTNNINKWAEIYTKALGGEVLQFVNEFVFKSSRLYLKCHVNPIWEDGKVTGLACLLQDITRQILKADKLRKSEASLRAILNNSYLSHVLFDADAKLVSFNTLAQTFSEKLNNLTLEEGRSAFDYFPEERRAFLADILTRAKNGETVNYQISRPSQNYTEWYDVTWVSIKNTGNDFLGYLLTNKDITDKKNTEIEREKLISDLTKRNHDLENFAFIMSHNLRSHVANIMGLSSLKGSNAPFEPEVADIMKHIRSSADKLDDVISNLNRILQANDDSSEE